MPALVDVGRISGVFGVRGWVKVHSYTAPRENIVRYSPWYLSGAAGAGGTYVVRDGRARGDGVVAFLDGVSDRDAAQALVGATVAVPRAALGEAPPAQFFWFELEGMAVESVAGQPLGTVDHLFETGANDVMVVVGSQRVLIPFIVGSVVKGVDRASRIITVDWEV
jgi:16S rRNA processing protein RimM